jgi:hypothetical protein
MDVSRKNLLHRSDHCESREEREICCALRSVVACWCWGESIREALHLAELAVRSNWKKEKPSEISHNRWEQDLCGFFKGLHFRYAYLQFKSHLSEAYEELCGFLKGFTFVMLICNLNRICQRPMKNKSLPTRVDYRLTDWNACVLHWKLLG